MTHQLLLQCDKAASTFDWLDTVTQYTNGQSGNKKRKTLDEAQASELQCGLYASIKDLASLGLLRVTNGMSKIQRLLYAWTDDYTPADPARVEWYSKDRSS